MHWVVTVLTVWL
jgi:hypothetical protein